MSGKLSDVLKRWFPTHWQRKRDRKELREWIAAGRPPRPPHVLKSRTVKEYAAKFAIDTLVETGTYHGDMVASCRDSFRQIYSIELSRDLFDRARKRFDTDRHVTLLQGDSAELLPRLLGRINEPCLFWLDAHYSGGNTAQGRALTPILDELDIIFRQPQLAHVILVDDAGDFVGAEGYPTIAELRDFVRARKPRWNLEVRDDIIRIHP